MDVPSPVMPSPPVAMPSPVVMPSLVESMIKDPPKITTVNTVRKGLKTRTQYVPAQYE